MLSCRMGMGCSVACSHSANGLHFAVTNSDWQLFLMIVISPFDRVIQPQTLISQRLKGNLLKGGGIKKFKCVSPVISPRADWRLAVLQYPGSSFSVLCRTQPGSLQAQRSWQAIYFHLTNELSIPTIHIHRPNEKVPTWHPRAHSFEK